MEALEVEALCLTGVRLKPHRFGGIEFEEHGRELGHVHGHGLLDVFLKRESARTLIAAGRVRPHHVFPRSRWISFQLESTSDVPFALELLRMARTNANQFLDAANSQV
ncbi:MAG: luciferase family protein [Verrucomicrobiota bacterium]